MDRLTKRDKDGTARLLKIDPAGMIEQLAAYEGSGMDPDECKRLSRVCAMLDTIEDDPESIAQEWKIFDPVSEALDKITDFEQREGLYDTLCVFLHDLRAAVLYGMRCMTDMLSPMKGGKA